jgi:predicted Zn-dependent protease with MMP-like domain
MDKMTFEEFEGLIKETVRDLPGQFKELLDKNDIRLLPREKTPSPLEKSHPGSIVFGVFIGVPMGRFVDMQTEPTRIELYKESFEKVYKDKEQVKKQIIKTVIHEIAHYFGFKESQIRKLGY